MKSAWIAVLCAAVLAAVPAIAAEKAQLKTDKEKNGYSIGFDIGRSLKKQPVEIDPESIARGVRDAFSGAEPAMTDQEVMDRLMALQKEIAAKVPEMNKKEGEEFLAKNKKEKGVKTTASGLQYKVITEGKGRKPKADDTVTVQYRGTLIDGTEFDSSYKRGQPATFPVKGVIPGWTEALQLMKEGSKYQLVIPANLAYGERGAGRSIGPNSTLIFEVELLSIAEPGAQGDPHGALKAPGKKEEKKEEKKQEEKK